MASELKVLSSLVGEEVVASLRDYYHSDHSGELLEESTRGITIKEKAYGVEKIIFIPESNIDTVTYKVPTI